MGSDPTRPAGQAAEGRVPTLEFRIPLSATPAFMRMLRYFLESLQVFGGPVGRAAHTVVSVSRDLPVFDIQERYPWLSDYSVQFHWLEQELFDRYEYDATGYHRFGLPSSADVVVLADADILALNDFDDAILEAYTAHKVLGVIAPASPFNLAGTWKTSSGRWWSRVFRAAGLPAPELSQVHSGWGEMNLNPLQRRCPHYYNYGFIAGSRTLIDLMGKTFEQDLALVERVADNIFKSQVANTIAFARHGIPCGTLPMSYNFTLNRRVIDRRRWWQSKTLCAPEEVKILHYLGSEPVSVRRDCFESEDQVEAMLAAAPEFPGEAVFLKKIRHIHDRLASRSAGLRTEAGCS